MARELTEAQKKSLMKIAIAIKLANDPEFRRRVEEARNKPMGLKENGHGNKTMEDQAGGKGDVIHAEKTVDGSGDATRKAKATKRLKSAIAAVDIYKTLRIEMKRLYYTPRTLAAGLGLPIRTVKCWYNGRGMLSREQYRAICKHFGVKRLCDPKELRMYGT